MITVINGIIASKQDIAELERRLRLGLETAFGRCYKGIIYLRTI